MASQYGKDVMICETGELESNSQGTYELLRKEINAVKSVPNNKGIGVFYWEPELNSSVVPDGYTLGATELVGNNKLHFTNALNAFKLAPDYLNTDCSYEMMNINSQKSVNIATGSQDNNAQVEQYTYDQWDSQKWIFEKVDSSYYKIVNKNSGKVLDVCGLSQNENAQVVQYEYNGGWNQQWKITTTSDGKYKIQNRWSGLYLGVLNNSTNDGASIVQVADKVNMCQIQKQIDNSKEEMMGVISFILAIFPLSFVINSYLVAMKNIGENQGTENIRTVFFYVLIFLIIGLMFIIMYILTSAIKIKAHRYSLLFILGIKKKDFWKILYKDYCITLLLIGVKSTIVGGLIYIAFPLLIVGGIIALITSNS